ncbi:MAG: hypothetical protein FH758_11985 [Firmicutes bacterium]|nr:hypothetical protein [Bacillota bacterium]
MEKIKVFIFGVSIIGLLTMIVGFLYKTYNKDGLKREYADIAMLHGIFIFLYALVIYFYLPNETLLLTFFILFIVLESLILIYRKNTAYWLTTRISSLKKVIFSIKQGETKPDTTYWLYNILIIILVVLLSLPFWINPNCSYNYILTICTPTAILIFIRSFLFKNDEGRASVRDIWTALIVFFLSLLSSLGNLEGFTPIDGKIFVLLLLIIFERKPPNNEAN